jgi:hypothetical protein
MRSRNVLGLVAAAFILLSAGAHGALGWQAMMVEIAKTNAPADLVRGLRIGWLFGSACMVIFGVLLLRLFIRRLRGHPEPGVHARIVGGGYLLFGVWALVTSQFDPFYAVFIVPGLLLITTGEMAAAADK